MTTDDLLFIFRERAAIIEFDGGYSRSHAVYLAAKHVRNLIAPATVPVEILQELENRE
jgi:hypothetical protein